MTGQAVFKTIKPYCLWILYTLALWCALSVLETYKEGSQIYKIAIGTYTGCTFTKHNVSVVVYILPLLFGLRIAPIGSMKAWNHVASPLIIGIYFHAVIAMLVAPYFFSHWYDFNIILSFVSGTHYILHSLFLVIAIAGTMVSPKDSRLAVWSVRLVGVIMVFSLVDSQIHEFGIEFMEIFFGSFLKTGLLIAMLATWYGLAWWMYHKIKETLSSWSTLYPILVCVPAMYAFAFLIYLA